MGSWRLFAPPQLDLSRILSDAATSYGVVLFDLFLSDGQGNLYPVPIVNVDQRQGNQLVNK